MKCLLHSRLNGAKQSVLSKEPSGSCLKGKFNLYASLFFMFFLAFVTANAFGQGITGSITGDVTDASGASVSGATVSIRQLDTNEIRTVTTSERGSYSAPQLRPGTYSITIDKTGFKTFLQNNVVLAIDQVVQINARLEIGSEQQTITVDADSPVLQTENSAVGLVIDSQTLQNTPLNSHLSIIGLL
jgi:hypothetical protein